jgi:hypothetical protein
MHNNTHKSVSNMDNRAFLFNSCMKVDIISHILYSVDKEGRIMNSFFCLFLVDVVVCFR